MRLPKDLISGIYTKPNLYLCETNKQKICKLETVEMAGVFKFNSYSELTCSVGRTYTDMITGEQKTNPFYDKIEALRLLHLEGFGYFEIQDPEIVSDGIQEVKNITAYSLEYNLSQKYLEGLEINTGNIGSIEVTYAQDNKVFDANGKLLITPVTLYNTANPQLSLLHIVLKKIYGWEIGHIDASLETMSRSFEISRSSVYDFIVQDICEKFNCFTVFDTINNTINFYAESLITKFIGDGVTSSFTITSPYDSISSVSIDSYKTTAWDYNKDTGVLTFDEAPASGARIEVTDGSQTQWITDVYVSFDNLAQEVNVSYSADDIKTVLTVKGADDLDIREVNMGLSYITDLSYYYSIDWMGQDLYDAYTAYLQKSAIYQEQYQENSENMLEINGYIWYETNRLSLQYSIASNVNSETVGTYYVRGGTYPDYYYTEVQLPADYSAGVEHYYTLSGSDINPTKVEKLYNALETYYYSEDDKDTSELEDETLKEDFAFMEEYALEQLITDLSVATNVSDKDSAVNTFLDYMWEQLGEYELTSTYYTKYKEEQAILIEDGATDSSDDKYWQYYVCTLIVNSSDQAIKKRQTAIEEYEVQYEELASANAEITNNLLMDVFFKNYYIELGINEDIASSKALQLLIRLNPFLREDEYTDDNFVITDADTIETSIQTRHELLECGRIELAKLCEPKLAFSMSMANIYALHEFAPIVDNQFQLGKLINVAIRKDYIKRARLLQVNINFDDFSDFSCEFGELTSLRTPSSIHADLLAQAMSAGKSVASSASYWNKGAELATSTDLSIQQGLLGAINGLYSSDQSITIDNNGILLRKVNEDGSFSPNQILLTNNTILYSTDEFKSAETGFGEFEIAGNTIYGVLADAVYAGYIESSDIIGGTINIGDGTFVVDSFGNVTMNAASIRGYVEEDGIISSINQSSESITINADRISLAGKTIDLTSDNIIIDSTNFSVTKDGKITATAGEIAGWTIYDHLLRKETTIDDVTYQMYMQAADGVDTVNAFAVRKKDSSDTDWTVQFAVNYAGKMTARNAYVAGTIVAEDGTIAGYNIGSGGSYDNAIYKRVSGDSSDYEVGLKATSGDTDLAFYVKETTDDWSSSTNTFYVRNDGKLYAQNADISGKITASSGAIGSWAIGDMENYTDSIYSTYCAASTPSSSNPEYAVFMRGKGEETTIAFGIKKRTSSSTGWADADNPFYVRKDGYVKMENANITGTIYSSSGTIGGFYINDNRLICREDNSDTSASLAYMALNAYDYDTSNHNAIIIGTRDSASDDYTTQFRVRYDGSVYMRNATVTGDSTIAAACIPDLSASKITSGTISTSLLDASVITTGNFSSKTLSTGNLTIESGSRLGAASEYNALLYSTGGYTWMEAFTPSSSYLSSVMNIVRAGVNVASSKSIKHDIHDFDDRYDVFFDKLKPQLFKYDFESHLGYSMGFIWEDSKVSMEECGLSDNDLGSIHESEGTIGGKVLRKDDFVALNTWQIQKLKDRVAELESRLAALEA